MRPSPRPFFATLLLLPCLSNAFDCQNIRTAGKKFNFDKIKGPHSASVIEERPPSIHNTTWTLDLCGPLKKDKEIDPEFQCISGTYVCGIKTISNDKAKGEVDEVYPIAGNYAHSSGKQLEPKFELLDKLPDSDATGLRIVLSGGSINKQKQQAIIDMQCDPERTGNEKGPVKKGKDDQEKKSEADDDDSDGEGDHDDKDEENSLRFVSYEVEPADPNVKTLRLEWRTKYACPAYEDDDDEGSGNGSNSKHWGLFTWFIVLLFLGISAYLIFSAWLNYNRYGARGWDLFPHSDTIRDMPYLFKDWSKKVVSTVSGGGGRGGYSAV